MNQDDEKKKEAVNNMINGWFSGWIGDWLDVKPTEPVQLSNHGWISVDDELPKSNGDFYLVFTDKGKITECRYYCDKWITTYCNNEKATHWQPLPEPPIRGA